MKNDKESTQKSERKAYWQLFPSLKYWKKTPNISKEINLLNPNRDDKAQKT
jgi:hypothetical protein